MDAVVSNIQGMPLPTAIAMGGPAVALAGGVSLLILKAYGNDRCRPSNLPPQIPGLPVVGNLLQLKEKKVVNSNDLAKEAMVTRFPSISTRNLTKALAILTDDKTMVAMGDYDDFHKTAKKHILTNVLGPHAQKRNRVHRDTMIENIANQLHACVENSPQEATLGQDVESIYVEDLGVTMSREDILKMLVQDPMEGAIEVDWRDFFPYLSWIPNKSFEFKIQQMYIRRKAVMKSLIQEQKKCIASGEKIYCYIDYLLEEDKSLSEKETVMLLCEPIIETSDTTMVTTEWAMYELAKDPKRQDCLYNEIQKVCGSDKITEEKLCQLPYLSAVFLETLRKHSPVPIVPLRHVHENTELGGYHVPAGSELAINIYGCNMDKNVWENPEGWNPERFLKTNETTLDLQKTISFGGGKRVCAGTLQAMQITCTSIARLVQEFEWRLKDGEEANVDTLGLTTHKLHPMQAFIKPRK